MQTRWWVAGADLQLCPSPSVVLELPLEAYQSGRCRFEAAPLVEAGHQLLVRIDVEPFAVAAAGFDRDPEPDPIAIHRFAPFCTGGGLACWALAFTRPAPWT